MKTFSKFAVLMLFVVGGIEGASADSITTFTRTAFQVALAGGSLSGQNFDAIASGTVISTVNGVTYSASLGNPIITNAYLTTTSPNGLGSTSLGYFGPTEIATIVFSSAITAFAIDINTFAPTSGDYLATLSTGATVGSVFDVFSGTQTGQFLGFTDSTPFTSVTIQAISDPGHSQYSYTLDTLVYGDAAKLTAPEPAVPIMVLAELGCLILCLAFFRPRKKTV